MGGEEGLKRGGKAPLDPCEWDPTRDAPATPASSSSISATRPRPASSPPTAATGTPACPSSPSSPSAPPAAIKASYVVQAVRIEPVGVVYLWPVSA